MPPREQELAGHEVAPVHKSEGRRLRPTSAGEAAFRAKAEAARARLLELQNRSEDDLERVQAGMDFEEANLDLEIFDLLHDPTGALKRETTGRDLAGQIESRWKKNGQERPILESPERITPVFMVNMGELDRLNKVSPDYGSDALSVCAKHVTDKILKGVAQEAAALGVQPETLFKVYREDSNSFLVRFERDVPKALADKLQASLSLDAGARWAEEGAADYFEGSDDRPAVESPPLIAEYVSLEESMAGVPRSVRGSARANTYGVSVLKDTLYSLMDARKVVSRAERMKAAIASGDEVKARDLYDKFLKKSLAGVFVQETGPGGEEVAIETFDQFKGYLASIETAGAGENPLWEQAFAKSLGDLQRRYEGDQAYAKKIQAFVMDKVKQERGVKTSSTPPPPAAEAMAFGEGEFQEPVRDEATEGLHIFADLRTEAGLQADNLEKAKAQGAPPEEIARLEQYARIAEKKVARERARRDTATGLELRGPMFSRLEGALAEGTKRVAMVSIDMGFLKYFDQMGGKETGDLAILTVAATLQKIKDSFKDTGIEVSLHRLGGDEFGMSVTAEASVSPKEFEARLDEIRAKLADETDKAGRIPPRAGAKAGYYPTKLEVGLGIHWYEDAAAAEAEAKKYGIAQTLPEGLEPGSEEAKAWARNQYADHLVKVADKVFGFQKSTSRFHLLLEHVKNLEDARKRGASEDDIDQAEDQIKQLLSFSDKAIFGQAGRDAFQEWRERVVAGESPKELDSEIHAFVWDHMETAFQEELAERGERLSHVEFAVRIEYLNGRIRELEKRLSQTDAVSEKLKERYEHEQAAVKERLKAAEEDLAALRTSRAALTNV